MSYLVLARKWRPMGFDDLVGQDHVARTLANAIKQDRVAHAFLFTGVRGVGKTTSARILAKALNCMRPPGSVPDSADPGPTASPCLKCAACEEIAKGSDVDVREIDGASYNGVDEVRRLQDALPYRPARDRYKIFIVDEVHMLSQNAWNAFLKTLEEPPPHVKFIFATTEVHKVPVTILSRVQRFDFRLIRARAIVERLRYVLSQENIQADDAALSIVAREAAGSMRDAMSLLDQVIAWGEQPLKGEDVARVLGVASRQALLDLTGALVRGDGAACLALLEPLAEQGNDIVYVARDLLILLRDLVVCKVSEKPHSLVDLPEEEQKLLMDMAASCETDDLVRLHQGFSEGYDDVARGGQPRASLEMLLVRLSRRPPLIPLDNLVDRLSAMERRLRGGPSSPPSRGAGLGGGKGSTPRSSAPRAAEPRAAEPRAAEPRASGREAPTRSTASPAKESKAADEPPPAPTRTAANLQAAQTSVLLLSRLRDVVEELRNQRPELASFLEHGAVLEADQQALRVAFEPGSIFVQQLSERENLDSLERAARAVLGKETRVTLMADHPPAEHMETLAQERVRARETKLRRAVHDARNHPAVSEVIEVFGARLKDLRFQEDGG